MTEQLDFFGNPVSVLVPPPVVPDLTHALTLWEPWASAVVKGPKNIENRPWRPPARFMGQRVWIHAGQFFDFERKRKVFALWPDGQPREEFPHIHYRERGIIGCARIVDVLTEPREGDDWWMGPFGWVLTERIAFHPVEVRGFQKLWTVPADVRELALAELRRVS